MSNTNNDLKIKYIDKRTRARYVNDGKLQADQVDAYLKDLPDMADEAENIMPILLGEAPEVTEAESEVTDDSDAPQAGAVAEAATIEKSANAHDESAGV